MTRVTLLWIGALALSACGPAPAPSSTRAGSAGTEATGGETATTTRATGLPEPCSGTCAQGDRCTNGLAWRCECTLRADVNCGGAPRPLGPGSWAWSCQPTDPRADRGDGCPFTEPTDGEPCSASPICRYTEGGCGWSGVDASCLGGVWHTEPFMMPPPP